MLEIPLFPLNTVLFPGMPINLHIFEERYKVMIHECAQNHQPFGVSLIRQGEEALGPLAEPHPIGCTAHITQIERLADGRMNILAVGLERFQIRALTYDKPYLVGSVELFPLAGDNPNTLANAGQRLRPWVERYLTMLSEVDDNIEFDRSHLPNDPLALGYLAAALVQIPLNQKQLLLATSSAADLLTSIRAIYRREVALLSAMIERSAVGEIGPFSNN